MANIMTKRGSLDNIVTYEHICDTFEDIQSIDPHYITLGSTCIVINGESGGLEVYMADSNKEWESISITSSESGGGSSSGIHICAQDEYDSVTGMPTIEDPLSNTFYLTPGGNETNDLYNEWIWLEDDEEWEKFGSATTAISQSDWNQSDSSADDFIKNKPTIRQQTNGGILENSARDASGSDSHAEGIETTASAICSHAEGGGTTASGSCSHAEGDSTIANHLSQHVFGMFNIADASHNYEHQRGNFVEIVGNGDSNTRSNARTLDWNGNEWLAGNLILNRTTLTESKLQYLNNLYIDNTLDIDKPVSTAQRAAIDAVATKTVEVTGTDVIIDAVSNTRYICGELSTLEFTPSITGISDVIFTSGSSKTILTLPSTAKMPDWFEVEENMTYEISIADGVYGVVTSWAV